MKWLITGGCGFIGTSLISKLQGLEGHSIRVIDNLTVGSRADLKAVSLFNEYDESSTIPSLDEEVSKKVQLVVGDVMDHNLALKVVEGVDIIVHLAANTGVGPSVEDPRSDCMVNVVGTFNYLEAARSGDVERFIFASSGAPAGEVEPLIHEELPLHPVSPYGASKMAGEGYCSAYSKTFNIDTVTLRFGNVYGPGSVNKNSVVAKFIRNALAGETLNIYGDGTQTRDFIFIEDLINAILLSSLKEKIGGEVFQIATNHETTLKEMVGILLKVLRSFGVKDVKYINSEARLGDVMRNFSDTTKARERLGWRVQTDLKEGLSKTVNYFMN